MDTRRLVGTNQGLRSTLMIAVIAASLIIGLGAGFGLSRVAVDTGHVAQSGAVSARALPAAGADMSAAAYAATHPTTARALPAAGADMSAAAYAATHPTTARALPAAGADMSAAAYAATHPTTARALPAAANP